MRARQRFTALLAAALILAGSFPVITVRAGQGVSVETPGEETTGQDIAETYGENKAGREGAEESGEETAEQNTVETSQMETAEQEDTDESKEETTEQEDTEESEEETAKQEGTEESEEEAAKQEGTEMPEKDPSTQETAEASGEDTTGQGGTEESGEETTGQEGTEAPDETDYPVPSEPPAFRARIERLPHGYVVKASFTDFTPDIVQIYTLYSMDGENWRRTDDGFKWNLQNLGTEDEDKLHELQNQFCLHEGYEPLKSYVSGKISHFYIKLHIIKQNGISYESQAAVIERGGLQQVPEGAECTAYFASEMVISKPNPQFPRLPLRYGGYQLTVSADTTAEDILALLPDTLPVRVEIICGSRPYASDIVDCPVTWKPLSPLRLSAGESITVPDAAEKIFVPAGTQLKTPIGIFELDHELGISTGNYRFDQVELTIHVIPEEENNPTGVLRAGINGLEIALNQKPTGATAIQAYVMTEGESKWTELSGLSLLSDMNAQYATTSSGYSLVLRKYQEPYRSYLEAVDAGAAPKPFFVGLKIQGGIYDGKQLILAWPDIYEQLPDLPDVGGSEGNEGNAGAANKDDSTEGGQRPNLPQPPDDDRGEEQQSPQTPPADDMQEEGEQPPESQTPPADDTQEEGEQPPEFQTPPADDTRQEEQPSVSQVPPADDGQDKQQQAPAVVQTLPPVPDDIHPPLASDNDGQEQLFPADTPETASAVPVSQAEHYAEGILSDPQETGQRPDLPQVMPDTADTSTANQEGGLALEPLVVQAAIEPVTATEHGSRAPILAVTATVSLVAVGGCIGAVIFKSTGYGLFHHIAGTIRKILHRF